MIRSLVSVLLALISVATPARAQAPSSHRASTLELRAQVGFLPLYGGDATVGGVSTWLPSVGLGYRLPVAGHRAVIETSVAHAGEDRDPYNRAPAFTFFGVLLRQSVGQVSREGVDPFLTVGLGRLRVDADEIVCEPPCFREGGPNFVDGTFTTIVGGGGLVLPLSRWGALRGDVRLFLPLNARVDDGDSGDVRFELAGGLVLRM